MIKIITPGTRMTREEILNGLYEIKNWKCNGDAKVHEIITNAIEALSEPTISLSAIEKIKANIDKLPDLNPDYPMDMTTHVSKWAVFEIIDKAVKECTHE